VRQHFASIGRAGRQDRPPGGEVGEQFDRQHTIAEPFERRSRGGDQQDVGSPQPGTERLVRLPRHQADIVARGRRLARLVRTVVTDDQEQHLRPAARQFADLVEPFVGADPAGINGDRPAGGQVQEPARARLV